VTLAYHIAQEVADTLEEVVEHQAGPGPDSKGQAEGPAQLARGEPPDSASLRRMAVWSITCGTCGRDISAEIVAPVPPPPPGNKTTRWLRCPNCAEGSVSTRDGAVYPPAPAGRSVKSLPPDVASAWQEARLAHSVAAYTASEIMCRKILMHLAVDKANAQAGTSFVSYIDALENAGFITAGLKPVIDQIRTRGNIANHDLPSSSEQESLTTLTITEHLLEAMYELPALAP
jgi:hypothetical protein